jgi:long-subunit acyl-CoA synthetase (AMP-forming)
MDDIEKSGFIKQYDHVSMKPEDCLTIIYTSGSSGFPKGAIISEEAYRATFPHWFASSLIERISFIYRPLAWAADRDAAIGTFFLEDVSVFQQEMLVV